jgi:hypothetical protein
MNVNKTICWLGRKYLSAKAKMYNVLPEHFSGELKFISDNGFSLRNACRTVQIGYETNYDLET